MTQIVCYICYEPATADNPYALDPRPCSCKGSIEIHQKCLQTLIQTRRHCTICKVKYNLAYLPQKNGRELIIEPQPEGGHIEYTVNENNQLHGYYAYKNSEGQTIIYHAVINGIMEGPYTEYYSNGNPLCMCRCKNNRIDGDLTIWYADGSIKEESEYKNGKKHGKCVKWKRDGYTRIATELLYEDGELISGQEED